MLGGRCRFGIAGSAPLNNSSADFFLACFNTCIFEGWGMSETSAAGCV